jgi:hypothetical protein
MAIDFRVQGVDFSGLGAGIAQGLQQAAAVRREQENIVRKEIDDFKSSYDTNKIMGKDIPLFATEFDNYRAKAIEFNKLNRGGANTEKISSKKAELDAQRSKLNKIYSDSSTSANILTDMVKYADRMTGSGYSLPDDMNADMMKLKTTPIDKINFDEFKAPTAYSFNADEKDFTQLDGALRGIKENKGSATIGKTFIPIGDKKDKDYKEIEVPEEETFTIKDPYAVLGRVTDALGADARLKNAAVNQKLSLTSNLNTTATDTDSLINRQLAKKTADKVLTAYPELEGDITKASPAMIIAANRGYLDRNTLGTSVSTKMFNAQLAALKYDTSTKMGKSKYEAALKKIAGKNSAVNSSTLRLIMETGGAMFDNEYLQDLGLTQDVIEQARKNSVQYYLQRGYKPGALQ